MWSFWHGKSIMNMEKRIQWWNIVNYLEVSEIKKKNFSFSFWIIHIFFCLGLFIQCKTNQSSITNVQVHLGRRSLNIVNYKQTKKRKQERKFIGWMQTRSVLQDVLFCFVLFLYINLDLFIGFSTSRFCFECFFLILKATKNG